jgi:hypothetical protein
MGLVEHFEPLSAWDSLFQAGFDELMAPARFEPGTVDGRKQALRIPVAVVFNFRSRFAVVITPLDREGQVADDDACLAALSLNGIEPPAIKAFPSYFYPAQRTDTAAVSPYALFRVKLTSAGEVAAIETAASKAGQYTDQLVSACLWGEYSPLRVHGEARACDAYLVFTLLPSARYPTEPLPDTTGHPMLEDRIRLRVLPDTKGLLGEPIPIHRPVDGAYVIPGGGPGLADPAIASVEIDTTGRVTASRIIDVSAQAAENYRKAIEAVTYYAARNSAGEAVPFSGFVRMEPESSTKIRIRFSWLPGETIDWTSQLPVTQ